MTQYSYNSYQAGITQW